MGYDSCFNISNVLVNKFGGKSHIGKLGKVGNITKITATNPTVITIKNHNLLDDQKIFVKQTNSFPNINGIYQKSVKVLTKDTFSINIDSNIATVEPFPLVPATVKTNDLVFKTFNLSATSLILLRLKSILVECNLHCHSIHSSKVKFFNSNN